MADERQEAIAIAHQATDDLTESVTVRVLGEDRAPIRKRGRTKKADTSLARSPEGAESSLAALYAQERDALEPPYDPRVLCKLLETSNALRQNVDAYAVNIDGYGHHFEPVINLDGDDVIAKVRDAMYIARLVEASGGAPVSEKEPTDEEVAKQIEALRRVMRVEKARAEAFFKFCCSESSFVALRRRTRADREITGNGYWEVIRGEKNAPRHFVYVPAHTVRLLKRDDKRVPVVQQVQRGPITTVKETVQRSFRRFVQSSEGAIVYFKEFSDPRVMSSKTGKFYDSVEALKAQEEGAEPANELIHFVIDSPTSPYGVPRWIGNLLSVLGSRHSEEVNFLYFENKSIPPLVITVSGGRMNADSVGRIRSFIDTQIKGKRNFHKILILEAESPSTAAMMGLDNNGRCRIDIKPLTEAHLKDALFQQYDERNMDKVGMAFRLPRLLRGDIRDFNRASALAALEFAETQVFGPERAEFDFLVNRFIMPALGIHFWRFESDGPRITAPESFAKIIAELSNCGVLVPKDGRELAGDRVFQRELPRIDADWVEKPVALTMAGTGLEEEDGDAPSGKPEAKTPPGRAAAAGRRRAVSAAKKLLRLRDLVSEAEAEEAVESFRTAKKRTAKAPKAVDVDDEPERITMSVAEMRDKLGVEPR